MKLHYARVATDGIARDRPTLLSDSHIIAQLINLTKLPLCLLTTQCWSQKLYSKCAPPALTRAAKTTPPLNNSCCTMTFAYCGDVHCQYGDQQFQIFKFSPKSDYILIYATYQISNRNFFSTAVLFFLSQRQRLNLDATYCRKRHFQ